jgi:hypothetical protein
MEPLRNLPNGKTTRSANVYVRAWRKLGNEVVKFFPGYTVVAYDSGLTLHKYKKNRFDETIVADRLNLNMPAIRALCVSQIAPFLNRRATKPSK